MTIGEMIEIKKYIKSIGLYVLDNKSDFKSSLFMHDWPEWMFSVCIKKPVKLSMLDSFLILDYTYSLQTMVSLHYIEYKVNDNNELVINTTAKDIYSNKNFEKLSIQDIKEHIFNEIKKYKKKLIEIRNNKMILDFE